MFAQAFSSPLSALTPLRRRPGHGGGSPSATVSPERWMDNADSPAFDHISSPESSQAPLLADSSSSSDSSESSDHSGGSNVESAIAVPSSVNMDDVIALEKENSALKETVKNLRAANAELQSEKQKARRIVLENFEGEFSGTADVTDGMAMALMDGDEKAMEELCAELDDGACPVEPTVSFGEALRDRAVWLVGLLVFQSVSGLILAHNEALLEKHPVIVFFLTMLVGAGGNAGNQASVRVIRGLALGTLNAQTQSQFLVREFKMAVSLSCLLSVAGFVRAAVFATPLRETIAITTALFMIVFSSICLGAVLPLGLKRIGIDPAHSSTSIQVIMDILGVFLAVVTSTLILDSPVGGVLISRLGMK